MKQKLTLLILAIFSTIGVWAVNVKIANTANGLPSVAGFGSFSGQVFTSAAGSGLAGVTVTASTGLTIGEQVVNVASYGNCFKFVTAAAGTDYRVTLAVPDGYIITGYSLGCSANTTNAKHTLTSEDGSVSIVADAPNRQGNAPKLFNVTGLSAQTTYFTINTANNGNTLYVPTFTITVMSKDATLVNVTYELYNGTTLVNSVTVKQEAGSDVNIPESLLSGYSSIAYDDFTAEGTIGNSDTTIKVNVNAKPGLVETLDNLSNNKAYLIKCERGAYTVVDGSLANTVKNSSFPVNNFAIISYENNYFLWSVEAGKFVACNGATLGDMPVSITMTKVANGLFKFQGGGLTMNATSGFATGGGFDSWTTTDEGNSCAIIEAAEFDPTDLLSNIKELFNVKYINLAVNVTGTTEAENPRAGKITMALSAGAYKKYLYADTKLSNLQYLDATFTAIATSYRGYEFTGFTIGDVDYGTSIETGELADVPTGATLVANYTASTGNGINLWYDYNEEMTEAYRLPAIVRTQSGRIIAFGDYRPGNTDVGIGPTSIERRYSDDNGQTWSPAIRVAQGEWGVNKSNVIGWSFGDPAAVADNTPGNSGNDVLMVCCGGNARWTSSVYNPDISQQQQGCVRWRSKDGGVTWSNYEYFMPALMKTLEKAGLRASDGSSGVVRAFFSSGKITQSVRKAEGAQYNRIYNALNVNTGNIVIYSDDFGATWEVLGGQVANEGDEAHVVELPDGAVLLVGKGGSSRWVNVFNYTDFSSAAGQWDTTGQWNNAVATTCHGDVEVVEAYDAYGEKNTVIVETAPMTSSPQRREIQYYFIALPKATGFGVLDFSTVGGASWTQGMNVTHNWGAYSSLLNNGNGTVDILFEECAKDETAHPTGYCLVYQQNQNIKDITNNQFFFSKEQAEAEGIKTPRPGHFYRFKGSGSNAYLTAGNDGAVTTTKATDATTIWYYDTNGLVSYFTGRCLDGLAKAQAAIGTSYKPAIDPSSYYEGKYTIKTNDRYTYDRDTNNTIDRGMSLNNDVRYAWIVEDLTSLPVVVGELGMAAIYSPVGLAIPTDVKAFSATKSEVDSSIYFEEVEAVKAGTGVLVKAEEGTYDFPITDNVADYSSDLMGNVATVAKSSVASAVYTLQSGSSFLPYKGTNITGFSSYILANADINAFDIVFGNAETGINTIESEEQGVKSGKFNTSVYDLSGRKINAESSMLNGLEKSIYIVDGKKIAK